MFTFAAQVAQLVKQQFLNDCMQHCIDYQDPGDHQLMHLLAIIYRQPYLMLPWLC